MEPDTKEGRTRLLGGSRGKGVDEPVNSPAVMRGEPHSARSPVAKPHPSLHTTLTPQPSSFSQQKAKPLLDSSHLVLLLKCKCELSKLSIPSSSGFLGDASSVSQALLDTEMSERSARLPAGPSQCKEVEQGPRK